MIGYLPAYKRLLVSTTYGDSGDGKREIMVNDENLHFGNLAISCPIWNRPNLIMRILRMPRRGQRFTVRTDGDPV